MSLAWREWRQVARISRRREGPQCPTLPTAKGEAENRPLRLAAQRLRVTLVTASGIRCRQRPERSEFKRGGEDRNWRWGPELHRGAFPSRWAEKGGPGGELP